MLTSIATVSLSGTLEEKIDAIAAAGFDGLEIFEADLVSCPLSPAEVRALCEERLLYVHLYQPFRDFEGGDEETSRRNLARAEAKLAVARDLGAPMMLVCANVDPASSADLDVVVPQLRALGDLAAAYGVRIAYEALAWSAHVATWERAWEVVAAVDHPWVGLCLDSFHILSAGSTLDALADVPGDRIFFCQLADAPAMSLDPLSWSRHFRVFPGQGGFDLVAFVEAAVRAGYDGPLSLEIFNDVFRQADPRRVAVDAQRSLRFLQDEVAQRVGRDHPATRRLVHLTPLQEVEGVDFVELAGRGERDLRDALAGLGFTRRGEHRSKPVELWSQGDVRMVLGDGPAPAVTALGLRVPDSDAAARRAEQLMAPAVQRTTSPGEVRLTAVTAPDASEIYFNDARSGGQPAWVPEFAEDSEDSEGPVGSEGSEGSEGSGSPAGPEDCGIVAVDHLSLAQPWQHFDEAVLFSRSVLGLAPSSSVDVADPSGLVRSQVLSSCDGGLRLVFNVLPAVLQDEVAHSEHVAFRSDDLLRTARLLRERGLETLPIPDNYYADAGARLGLGEDLLHELSELDVLVDRDGDATFLQLYTRSYGSLFFEVVQRIDGYAGFGAVNAPVRRAAQRRQAGRPLVS